jgi:hypothetical protein
LATFLSFLPLIFAILLGLSAFFDKWATLSHRAPFHGRPWINTAALGTTRFKIWWFIILTILAGVLTLYNSQQSDAKIEKELSQRDLAHQRHDDSLQSEYKKDIRATNDSNIASFSKSLEEYNLVYNEQQKKVQSLIRDSMTHENPGYIITASSQQGTINGTADSLIYTGLAVNTGNCPIIINTKIYVGQIINGLLYCSDTRVGSRNTTMAQGTSAQTPLYCQYTILPSKVYFLYIGSYSNRKKTIVNPIDEIMEWTLANNSIGNIVNFVHPIL